MENDIIKDAKSAAKAIKKARLTGQSREVDLAAQFLSISTALFANRIADLPGNEAATRDLNATLDLLGNKSTKVPADTAIEMALSTSVRMLASVSGSECRMAVPFSGMRVVRDQHGNMLWTCGHSPSHDTPI